MPEEVEELLVMNESEVKTTIRVMSQMEFIVAEGALKHWYHIL